MSLLFVHIQNLNGKIVKVKTDLTFLQNFGENQVDWMHACGGKGRCTTCKMTIIDGIDNISNPSAFEGKLLEKKILSKNERLACQCFPKGHVTINVPHENKLPHIKYSDGAHHKS